MSSLLSSLKPQFDFELSKCRNTSMRSKEGWVIVKSQRCRLKGKPDEDEETDFDSFDEGFVQFEEGIVLICVRSDIQFRHIDHLHYGSFGDLVTRAKYTPTNRAIVTKIIRIFDRLSGRNEGRSMTDILRKMELAASLKHENIVRLHGNVIEEMTCYMVMEPMQASLSEVIKIVHNFTLPKLDISQLENFLGGLTVDVVAALAFLCEIKINAVLSPKRVLIGVDGTVKITSSAAFKPGGATPVRYSAPELLENTSVQEYSKTGVWSLAILLIEAATGSHPYSGSIDFVVADQIVDEKIQPRLGKEFSHKMRNFVDVCLFHSPQSRSSASAADANCLQNKRFYRHHLQRENRKDAVKGMLNVVQPHLEGLRKET